jgi:flavin reductase (DIM6/NTAB) family NADH-FMN oxidoreductase RutF
VIDSKLKRALGQMVKGVQVVGAAHDGVVRAYTSHWVSQVAFEEPVVMGVGVAEARHLPAARDERRVQRLDPRRRPGRRGAVLLVPRAALRYIADEYLEVVDGLPVVRDCVAWLRCEVFDRKSMRDHELFFAEVTAYGYGQLKEPTLLYSSRHGWRVLGDRARRPGDSIRDRLLARLRDEGYDVDPNERDDDED